MTTSTIVATAGATNANSYITMAFAHQYHEDRPLVRGDWISSGEAGDENERTRAILWATKMLDRSYVWEGVIVSIDQALLWPRSGLLHPNGESVANDSIPIEIQNACAEYARILMYHDLAAGADSIDHAEKFKFGNLDISSGKTPPQRVIPGSVARLLPGDWGRPLGLGFGQRRVMRS